MKKSTKTRRIRTAKDLLKLKTSVRAGATGNGSPKEIGTGDAATNSK
jgi:hypothetical protein